MFSLFHFPIEPINWKTNKQNTQKKNSSHPFEYLKLTGIKFIWYFKKKFIIISLGEKKGL